MANPRQRRKARSGTHRPVSHSRRQKTLVKKMPPIRGPKVLQDNWDKHKTVRQNYAALGLLHTLNPRSSGGDELSPESISPEDESNARSAPVADSPSASALVIPRGYGRIIRDSNANVIMVAMPDEEEEIMCDSSEKDMEQLEKEMGTKIGLDGGVLSAWASAMGGLRRGKQGDGIVGELERGSVSSSTSATTLSLPLSANPVGRHVPRLAKSYLERLFEKYGTDVEKMSRDGKLNPEQRTVGELRRGFRLLGML